MLHILQWLYTYVASFCSQCFNVCCKCVYLNVARVSHICCMCFIWMLHIFCNGFFKRFRCFTSVLDVCCKCFNLFECMFQIFHLNVSKVDRVLHLPPRLLLPHLGVSFSSRCWWYESAFALYVSFGVLMIFKLGISEILMRYIAALVPWKF